MADSFLPRASQPGSQADSLCGEAPGARGEVVVQRVELLHPGEVPSQEVLPADFRHAREVVDFLKRSQAVILLPGGSGSAWGLGSPESSGARARSRWKSWGGKHSLVPQGETGRFPRQVRNLSLASPQNTRPHRAQETRAVSRASQDSEPTSRLITPLRSPGTRPVITGG